MYNIEFYKMLSLDHSSVSVVIVLLTKYLMFYKTSIKQINNNAYITEIIKKYIS